MSTQPVREVRLAALVALLVGCGTAPFMPAYDAGTRDAGVRDASARDAGSREASVAGDGATEDARGLPADAGGIACDPPLTRQALPPLVVACEAIPRDPRNDQIAWFHHALAATAAESPSLAITEHDALLVAALDGDIVLHRAIDPTYAPIPIARLGRGRTPQLAWSDAGSRFGLAYHDVEREELVLVELDATAGERRRLRARVPGHVEHLARPYWTGCRWLLAWTGEDGATAAVFRGGELVTTWIDATLDGVTSAGSEFVTEPSRHVALTYLRDGQIFTQYFDAEGEPDFVGLADPVPAALHAIRGLPVAAIHDDVAGTAWAGQDAEGTYGYAARFRDPTGWSTSGGTGYTYRSLEVRLRAALGLAPTEQPRIAHAGVAGNDSGDSVQRWEVAVGDSSARAIASTSLPLVDPAWTGPPYDGPVASDLAHHPCGVLVAWDQHGLSNRIGLLLALPPRP